MFARKVKLCATLYGSLDFFEDVKSFAKCCGFFLQDPESCELDVPYRNPHCLTPLGAIPTTFELAQELKLDREPIIEASKNPIDLFADQEELCLLPEANPPGSLATEMYPHQKQALTFMLRRESGWALKAGHKDVWKEQVDPNEQVAYVNTVAGIQQSRPPREFKGGLLIDAPGLGKSLSVLSLIATDVYSWESLPGGNNAVGSTLLVIPTTCEEGFFCCVPLLTVCSDSHVER